MWLENMRAPRERGRALLVAAGYQLVTCYETGPFGYGLHRQLTALGVTNHVIRPRNWDDQHKRVKTDRTDALAIWSALDRFVAGNPHALAVVRVPTAEQERLRTQTPLRQSLQRDLKQLAQARSARLVDRTVDPVASGDCRPA